GGARACEAVLGAGLGAWALALHLHAPVPVLAPRAPSLPLELLEAPRRSGPSCSAVVWLHAAQPGRALLRGGDAMCLLLPGDRALARVRLDPLAPARNPGGSSSERRWRRVGVRSGASVVDGLFAPIATPAGLRAGIERTRRAVGNALDPPSLDPATHDPEGAGRAGALLRALVTGQRERLGTRLRGVFERSGTAHLLAVSGLHVACVFAAVSRIARGLLARVPYTPWIRSAGRVALGLGVAAAGSYAALSGAGLPALRATAMAAAGTLAVLLGRPAASANALALAATFVLALEPAALFDPGFALSFSAVAGILLWRPPVGGLRALSHATLAAGLATAPWVAMLGVPLSASGPLANLAAVPFFGMVVVPLGLLSGAAGALSGVLGGLLRPFALGVAELGIRGLEGLAGPDVLRGVASPIAFCCALCACGFALRLAWLHRSRAGLAVAVASACAATFAAQPARNASPRWPEAWFLDVGHGDAVLLRSGDHAWLVDTGPRFGRFDAGRRVVGPALAALGVRRLDALVVTHGDRDHSGGVGAVLARLVVDEVWLSAQTAWQALDLRRDAAARGIPLRLVSQGDGARLGEFDVSVLWPPPGARYSAANRASLVLRVEGPDGCALLPGDVPARVERQLDGPRSDCAVLKLAHHGSGSSTGAALLARERPWVAVASAGRRRRAPLPHADVRARLDAALVTLWETHRHGAVHVRFTPHGLVVTPFLP
ncbi:MAG: DNA internalization-related competence protein ComEC/Rec2, partial [Deltaproteobacteria bacterium]|nr:DNA internalization-related competence protein ComEC/Rec2 [Deltaproteobacteria bacterium]